jgi:hypothetical protein
MRFSHHANTADAVELEETAPQRGQRSPMHQIVAKYLLFNHSVDINERMEPPLRIGFFGRLPATLENRISINFHP